MLEPASYRTGTRLGPYDIVAPLGGGGLEEVAKINITPGGASKVLDFGLANALNDDPSASNTANSPTMSMAATGTFGLRRQKMKEP